MGAIKGLLCSKCCTKRPLQYYSAASIHNRSRNKTHICVVCTWLTTCEVCQGFSRSRWMLLGLDAENVGVYLVLLKRRRNTRAPPARNPCTTSSRTHRTSCASYVQRVEPRHLRVNTRPRRKMERSARSARSRRVCASSGLHRASSIMNARRVSASCAHIVESRRPRATSTQHPCTTSSRIRRTLCASYAQRVAPRHLLAGTSPRRKMGRSARRASYREV